MSPAPDLVYAVVEPSGACSPQLREQLLEMWVDVTNAGGAGRLLLEGLHRSAVGLGLEQLMLTTRGGTGVEGFYERFGYSIVGRHPGAIRLAPGDDRDEIILIYRL